MELVQENRVGASQMTIVQWPQTGFMPYLAAVGWSQRGVSWSMVFLCSGKSVLKYMKGRGVDMSHLYKTQFYPSLQVFALCLWEVFRVVLSVLSDVWKRPKMVSVDFRNFSF